MRLKRLLCKDKATDRYVIMAIGRQGGLVAIHGRRPAALACDLPCIMENHELHNYRDVCCDVFPVPQIDRKS